jgi:hypothetical protein
MGFGSHYWDVDPSYSTILLQVSSIILGPPCWIKTAGIYLTTGNSFSGRLNLATSLFKHFPKPLFSSSTAESSHQNGFNKSLGVPLYS